MLLTGRGTSAQWHTNTRTGKSDVLAKLYPENAYVEINTRRCGQLGDRRQKPRWRSLRAAGRWSARPSSPPMSTPGQVFIPMHYGIANRLTRSETDPVFATAEF